MAKTKSEKLETSEKGTSVTLVAKGGVNGVPDGLTRTFSLEEHGEDYLEQAEAWKKKYCPESK